MQSIFGTDGIRGKFNREITCSLASSVGYALALTLTKNEPIVIGRDTRESGNLLLEALSLGISAGGMEVIDIGVCPTPAIPFLIKKLNFSSGIMISASHNPPEYNGIKIFNQNGQKIPKNYESKIQSIVEETNGNNLFSSNRLKIQRKVEILDIYIKSLILSLKGENLKGLKIILDTCHGSATTCAEKVFKGLGANFQIINNNQDGSKINLNCGSTCLSPLKKALLENNADMGFSFDGDADRVIGIDSKGNILDGDHILFLWGRELMEENILTNKTLISTEMANLGFEKSWQDLGGILHRTPVGDKFIYEELINKKAILGGEQSGHILSKINNYCGDGILTAIQISKYCKRKQITLRNWLKSSFFAYPQKLTNIPLNIKSNKLNKSFQNYINETKENYLKDVSEPCRIFIRPSGTEPVLRVLVEAKNQSKVDYLTKEITYELEKIIYKESIDS